MKYLIDTITFNTYRDIKMGVEKKPPEQVDAYQLEKFIDNNKKNIFIHSATLFELYIKCIRNINTQKTYRSRNEISLEQFRKDYEFIHTNGFKILNEEPYYFDQNRIVDFFNEGKIFEYDTYIKEKIQMEVKRIIHYILFIDLIFSYELFDRYGDDVRSEVVSDTISLKSVFLKYHLEIILDSYYYSSENKKASIKRIDQLLGYILDKSEQFIISKFYLCTDEQHIENTLIDAWSTENIENVSGTEKVSRCFEGYKTDELIGKIDDKVKKIRKLNPNMFSHVEECYFKNLLKKSIIDKYKITKNDFSDFLIISAGDFNNSSIINDEIVVITYDKRLKRFLEENKFYYNDELYNLIYRD